jgi:uncharacterized protein YbjT (DUF2867 family)
MGQKGDFEAKELTGARNVAHAAKTNKLSRIVYLGGLHPATGELSKHLRSRAEVGEILLDSGVPTVALQAGVIIGSGSTSFEMIRHLTDVLPVMTAPKWVGNLIQPIAVRDVMYYLIKAADLPASVNRTLDIGGPEVLKYSEMMNGYAVEAGMKERAILRLPVLTPTWPVMGQPRAPIPCARCPSLPHFNTTVMNEHDIDRSFRTARRLIAHRTRSISP